MLWLVRAGKTVVSFSRTESDGAESMSTEEMRWYWSEDRTDRKAL